MSEDRAYDASVLISFLVLLSACQDARSASSVGQLPVGNRLSFSDQTDGLVVKAAAGENVVLECEAEGNPSPTIHWLFSGHRIQQGAGRDFFDDEASFEAADGPKNLRLGATRSRLFIDCVGPANVGDYECVAETPTQRIVSRTRLQVVSPKPGKRRGSGFLSGKRRGGNSITDGNIVVGGCTNKRNKANVSPARIFMWSVNRLELEGADVQLFCRASGGPETTVTWYDRNEHAIDTSDPQYKVLSNGDLLIRDVSWSSNMGMYRCVAENSAGSDATETFLYPTKA